MITMEKIEKLRTYSNISFEEAKLYLELAEGNILDAVILLEKEGKIKKNQQAEENKFELISSDKNSSNKSQENENYYKKTKNTESFNSVAKRFFKWCEKVLTKGNQNRFDVIRFEKEIISIPITILVILLICFFWIIFPLLIVGLFFNFRYQFSGVDLGKENINSTSDSISQAAENLKTTVKDAVNEHNTKKNTNN